MKNAVLFASALILASCGSGPRLSLEVKVADLHRRANSYAANQRPDHLVEISVPGQLFQPASPLNLVPRGAANWSTPGYALSSVISAYVSGDVAWIVDNYAPAEREQVSKKFADPAMADRTRAYYHNIGRIERAGWAEVRGHRVEFLRAQDQDGDTTLLSVTLAPTAAGWRQTEALADDDLFEVVWTAFQTGGVR